MREFFSGYYEPSAEQFKALWEECIFVFDANVLLNIYRYSPKTLKNFLDILERLQKRIWLPHQAALEYQRNRLAVISEQHQAYDDIPKSINDLLTKIGNSYPRHPVINIRKIIRLLDELKRNIQSELDRSSQKHQDLISGDALRDKLDNLFGDNIGKPYEDNQLKGIYADADKRYQGQRPPGYKDNKKPEGRKYGDVIIWFQIKDYAKLVKKPILLITDDRKDDWWLQHKGKTIGPRPELVQELKTECNVEFYMYESDRFISYAQEHLRLEDAVAASEAKEVKQFQQELGRGIRWPKEDGESMPRAASESWDSLEGALRQMILRSNPGTDAQVHGIVRVTTEIIKYLESRPNGGTVEELIGLLYDDDPTLVKQTMRDLVSFGIVGITDLSPDVKYTLIQK